MNGLSYGKVSQAEVHPERLLRSCEQNARKGARQAKLPAALSSIAATAGFQHAPQGAAARENRRRRRKNQGGLACVLRLFHPLLTRAARLAYTRV